MTPAVKDAYLSWKANSKMQLILGISPSPTFDVIDKIWGYRSVEKSPLDLQKFASSRDFGVALKGHLDNDGKIRYHAMLANGNGNSSEKNRGTMIPIISIVGQTNSGKTTLIERLIPEFTKQGFRIGTINHDAHDNFQMDHEGKDTWRHKQAGTATVLISSARKELENH